MHTLTASVLIVGEQLFKGLLARFVEFSFKAIESAFEHSRHNIHGIGLRRILVNLSTNHTEIHAQHVWLVYIQMYYHVLFTPALHAYLLNLMTDGF